MIFINSHFTIEPARPLTPNVVQIGGIHLTPPNPIPKVTPKQFNRGRGVGGESIF